MSSVDSAHLFLTQADLQSPQTLAELLMPLQTEFDALNRCIDNALHSDIALVQQIARHLVEAGGKRLRPALLLLVAQALHPVSSAASVLEVQEPISARVTMAAVIEFIHTATLLHDDVVDESHLRRGRQTANALFGNAASVLVGDFLYSRAFQLMVGLNSLPTMQIIANATNVIAEGEVLQLLNIGDVGVDEARYLQVVQFKTAKLFEAAAEVAAVLAGANEAVVAEAAALGRHLGSAFQLIDDVLDYTGNVETIGKNVGDDLREGKLTLPLIRALQTAQIEQQFLIRQALDPQAVAVPFAQIIAIIHSTDALDYTRARAADEITLAKQILLRFPASAARQTLIHFCDFAISRQQ